MVRFPGISRLFYLGAISILGTHHNFYALSDAITGTIIVQGQTVADVVAKSWMWFADKENPDVELFIKLFKP